MTVQALRAAIRALGCGQDTLLVFLLASGHSCSGRLVKILPSANLVIVALVNPAHCSLAVDCNDIVGVRRDARKGSGMSRS